MLKKIFLGFAAFIVLLGLVGFALPTTFKVEHQEHIVAAPKMIFAFIGDLRRWKDWTSWAKNDPQTEYQHSDPSYGVGATQKWKSQIMGSGQVEVTQWSPENVIAYKMQIDDWQPSTGRLQMGPAAQGAMVIWTMDGQLPSNPYMRYLGFILKWWIKKDFREGLTNLKKLAESSVAAEVKAPWQQPAAHRPTGAKPK